MSEQIDWRDDVMPEYKTGLLGRARAVLRVIALMVVVLGGFGLFLLLRLIERPLFGMARPWTPVITQAVCRLGVAVLGIRLKANGKPLRGRGAMVSNHGSWLDIFTLNACSRIYFVSKAEVANWPGIGWLARATGTLFIERKGTEAKNQQSQFEQRLRFGHKLMFFPEGTSTDSQRMLPFKSTLFAAFYSHGLEQVMRIQPVTVVYRAPPGCDPRFYGWWGGMSFGGHLWQVARAPRGGSCEITFHPPVAVEDIGNRKQLSAYCETTIRAAHPSLQS